MLKSKDGVADIEVLGEVVRALKKLDDAAKREWVISSAISNLGIKHVAAAGLATNPNNVAAAGAIVGNAVGLAGEVGSNPHARAFYRLKRPQRSAQQLAVLAYYLATYRGMVEVNAADLKKMNTDAGGTSISNIPRDLDDAHRKSHYFSPATDGRKVLTGLGEDVVNALPDQGAVKAVLKENRKPRKKGKKNRKSEA